MVECSFETLQAIRLKVVEASPDAKIVINRKREIVDVNEEAEYIFGYAREDMLGQFIEMLLPEEKRPTHADHVAKFFRNPRRREMGEGMKLEALDKEGDKFQVKIKLAPLVIPGKEGGLFGLAVVRRVEL